MNSFYKIIFSNILLLTSIEVKGQLPNESFLITTTKPLGNSLDKLLQLNPVNYEYEAKAAQLGLPLGEQTGFLTAELKKVFPGIIRRDIKWFLTAKIVTNRLWLRLLSWKS